MHYCDILYIVLQISQFKQRYTKYCKKNHSRSLLNFYFEFYYYWPTIIYYRHQLIILHYIEKDNKSLKIAEATILTQKVIKLFCYAL